MNRLPKIIGLIFFFYLISQLSRGAGSGSAGLNYSTTAGAQEFNYARAFNDYLYTLGKYREAHREYIVARQAYLAYQTLTSKATAQEKTLAMLRARDETVHTYLAALRMRLAASTGVTNYEQSILYLRLDDELSWYEKHKNNLPSAGSLEDLEKTAEEAQRRWLETEISAYKTLEVILRGKEKALLEQMSTIIEDLGNKLAQIRQKGDKKTTISERWLLEAENRLTRSKEKQNESLSLIQSFKSYDVDKSRKFFEAQFVLEESHQYLKEAVSNLKELIREIKSAD